MRKEYQYKQKKTPKAIWNYIESKTKVKEGIGELHIQGRIQGACAHPPLKLKKKMIFLRKIVIFHTKYPKRFRASLHSVQLFLSAPPPLT